MDKLLPIKAPRINHKMFFFEISCSCGCLVKRKKWERKREGNSSETEEGNPLFAGAPKWSARRAGFANR